jgi:hypothetical protein
MSRESHKAIERAKVIGSLSPEAQRAYLDREKNTTTPTPSAEQRARDFISNVHTSGHNIRDNELLAELTAIIQSADDWKPAHDALAELNKDLCEERDQLKRENEELKAAQAACHYDMMKQRELCDSYREKAEALDAVFERCKITLWPKDNEYPLEHNPWAQKDNKSNILAAINQAKGQQ